MPHIDGHKVKNTLEITSGTILLSDDKDGVVIKNAKVAWTQNFFGGELPDPRKTATSLTKTVGNINEMLRNPTFYKLGYLNPASGYMQLKSQFELNQAGQVRKNPTTGKPLLNKKFGVGSQYKKWIEDYQCAILGKTDFGLAGGGIFTWSTSKHVYTKISNTNIPENFFVNSNVPGLMPQLKFQFQDLEARTLQDYYRYNYYLLLNDYNYKLLIDPTKTLPGLLQMEKAGMEVPGVLQGGKYEQGKQRQLLNTVVARKRKNQIDRQPSQVAYNVNFWMEWNPGTFKKSVGNRGDIANRMSQFSDTPRRYFTNIIRVDKKGRLKTVMGTSGEYQDEDVITIGAGKNSGGTMAFLDVGIPGRPRNRLYIRGSENHPSLSPKYSETSDYANVEGTFEMRDAGIYVDEFWITSWGDESKDGSKLIKDIISFDTNRNRVSKTQDKGGDSFGLPRHEKWKDHDKDPTVYTFAIKIRNRLRLRLIKFFTGFVGNDAIYQLESPVYNGPNDALYRKYVTQGYPPKRYLTQLANEIVMGRAFLDVATKDFINLQERSNKRRLSQTPGWKIQDGPGFQ